MFQTFVSGFDDSGSDDVDGYLASPHPQLSQALSSINEADCICALWNETRLQSLNAFHAAKKCFHGINNKLPCSMLFMLSEVILCFSYWHFVSSWTQIGVLK
jgi:hypothetical protein